jgi:hypothetical protein
VIGAVEFGPTGLLYSSYPYAVARVYPHGTVAVADIRDVDPDAAPPEVRLRSGETLFVSARQRDDLRAFCEVHAIAVRRRPDVWADLLEPFLDTELTAADDERTASRLAAVGLGREEVARIRAEVGDAMVAYNFGSMLWEWVHLGLFDVLEAHAHRLPPDDFTQFYSWAMGVADLAYDQKSSQA